MLEVEVIVPELGEVIAVTDTKTIIGDEKSVVVLLSTEEGTQMALQVPAETAMTLSRGLWTAARRADPSLGNIVRVLQQARAENA